MRLGLIPNLDEDSLRKLHVNIIYEHTSKNPKENISKLNTAICKKDNTL